MKPKNVKMLASALLVLVALLSIPLANLAFQRSSPKNVDPTLDPNEIKQTITRVADWQLDHPVNAARYPTGAWTMAPLYLGLIDTSLVTGEPKYLAPVIRAGRQVTYAPGDSLGNADSYASGNAWLRIYLMNPKDEPEILQRFVDRFNTSLKNRPAGMGWSWVDALYMLPPTMVDMAQATGNTSYLDRDLSEVQATQAKLFDPQDHLFYRDASYISQRTPNGKKVFWSRGNGWAYASLTEMLSGVPTTHPSHQVYLTTFTQMSQAILQTQQPDGLWYPSLLDPQQVPIGETSGSALFLYGMAWGVNHGVLDRATYLPAIERGWNALLTRIKPDGEVNYVQPVSASPKPFDPKTSAPYGTGAVLEAGAEILRLLKADATVDPAQLRTAAEQLAPSAPDLSK